MVLWNLLFGRRLPDEEYALELRSMFEDYLTFDPTKGDTAHQFDDRIRNRLERFRPANTAWDPLHTALRQLVRHQSTMMHTYIDAAGHSKLRRVVKLQDAHEWLCERLNDKMVKLSEEDRVRLLGERFAKEAFASATVEKEMDDEHYSLVARMVMFRILLADRVVETADAKDLITANLWFDPMPLLEDACAAMKGVRPAREDYRPLHRELARYVRLAVEPLGGSAAAGMVEGVRSLLEGKVAVRSCLAALGRKDVEQLFGPRLAGLAGHVFEVEELRPLLDEADLDPHRLGTLLLDFTTTVSCDRCGRQETYNVPLSAAGGSTEEVTRLARYWHDRQCPRQADRPKADVA